MSGSEGRVRGFAGRQEQAENGRFSLTSFSETFEETECVLNKLAGGAEAGTVSAEGQSCHLNGSRQVGGMT